MEELQRKAHSLNEIAILVRAGFQTREFEERFITLGIPYRVIGGPRFYERMEIRDAVAWLRIVHSTDDDLAFERIVNKPKRGLGNVALRTLHGLRTAQAISLFDAAGIAASSSDLRPQARRSLGGFVQMVGRWRRLMETASHIELAETVLDESGYTAMWQQDKSPDAPGRLENLKELVRALEEFENLGGFLEHIALVMEATAEAQGDMVNIMTLHSAKGLEFDTVFLPGWEEGVFPHQRALDESGEAGLEEERRLAYVGLTRARKNVHISFAANRRIHNQWASSLPSRFVDELPPHVEVATEQGLYAGRSGMPGRAVVEAGGGRGARRQRICGPRLRRTEFRRPEFQRGRTQDSQQRLRRRLEQYRAACSKTRWATRHARQGRHRRRRGQPDPQRRRQPVQAGRSGAPRQVRQGRRQARRRRQADRDLRRRRRKEGYRRLCQACVRRVAAIHGRR